jgi:YHS domain-containing protein
MRHGTTRRSMVILALGLSAFAVAPAFGDDIAPTWEGVPRMAIGGYDTVAYHTVGKAVPGKPDYQTTWHDARWQFSSQENLDLFKKDPEKYAAQYDGHCAMGVAHETGHKDTVDPEAFTIVNGKLYLNHTKYWALEWRKNSATNISRADKNWAEVKDTPEPEK